MVVVEERDEPRGPVALAVSGGAGLLRVGLSWGGGRIPPVEETGL